MAQNLVVAMLVVGCFVYTLWSLAPKAPRGRLATALLKLQLPGWLQKPLTAAAKQQGACGCDGCDRSASAKVKQGTTAVAQPSTPEFKPMTFVPSNFSKKTRL